MTADTFVVCSICRQPIAYGSDYYQCSVSTCNRSKLALYFCGLPCFSAHVPGANHRDAWAELVTAPAGPDEKNLASQARGQTSAPAPTPPRRVVVATGTAPASASELAPVEERDVLIVVSKLKAYVKARSGMNTSDAVIERLSEKVRALCDEAIRNAAREGRKTVLDRDVLRKRGWPNACGADNDGVAGRKKIRNWRA